MIIDKCYKDKERECDNSCEAYSLLINDTVHGKHNSCRILADLSMMVKEITRLKKELEDIEKYVKGLKII